MRRFFCLLLLILLKYQGLAQPKLEQVKGLPTETIYNLLVDKKGFLWVGHSLGVSRYDGIRFTSFTNPEQTSLGVTDLTEDDHGRIWFHNFLGQIFYVENEKINLLKEYDYTKEQNFPTILYFNGEICATTSHGLFVCNTKTLQSKFINNKQKNIDSRHLTICNNRLIIYDSKTHFSYKEGDNLIPIKYKSLYPADTMAQDSKFMPALNLQDSVILYSNALPKIFVLKIDGNSIYKLSEYKADNYINTTRSFNKKIWVNTKSKSYSLNSTDTLYNLNLTDIVSDKFGNTWYASLQNGLSSINKEPHWEKSDINTKLNNDFVRSVIQKNNYTIFGTQFGKVLIYDAKKHQTIAIKNLPGKAGSVENLFFLPNGRLLIGGSLGQYYLNIATRKLYTIYPYETLKTVALNKNNMVLGYANKVALVPLDNKLNNYLHDSLPYITDEDLLIKKLANCVKNNYKNLKPVRSYFVSYDSSTNKTFCAIRGGLYELKNDSLIEINSNLFSSVQNIIQYDSKVYLGTISRGFQIIHNQEIKNIDQSNGLVSNIILQMKRFGNKIFLYLPNYIQVFDIKNEKIIQTIPLPDDIHGSIYDMALVSNILNITTSKNIYSIGLTQESLPKSNIYLLAAKYEHKEIEDTINTKIPYDNKGINFYIGFPYYKAINKVQYQYRLLGSGDTTWQRITTNINKISFVSLKPGKYIFECNAVDGTQLISANTISYTFTISQPWWLSIWFLALTVLTIVTITALSFKIRINIKEKINEQKIQSLKLEQKLTQSTLATIRSQMNPHFIFNALNTIQSFMFANDKISVNTYLVKFSKLIRTVLDFSQTELIPLQKELQLIKAYTELENKRFDDAIDIHFNLSHDVDTENILIPPLLLQPYVENAFNHGLFQKEGDKKLMIEVKKESNNLKDFILVKIEDNGIGRKRSLEINKQQMEHKSFATNAGESRIELLNKTKHNKIALTILDKYNASGEADGTIVELRISIVYKD